MAAVTVVLRVVPAAPIREGTWAGAEGRARQGREEWIGADKLGLFIQLGVLDDPWPN